MLNEEVAEYRRELSFPEGGGVVGAAMRAQDWSGSPLNSPETWPQSLRSVVGLMLGSEFPMFVAWGDELGFLYNDAYTEILGAKHPAALGARFQDTWSEIWPDISPLIDAAMAGEATYHENLPLTMNRRGFDEQTWFTFSYSPVRDESGRIAGMFCACTETTQTVLADRALRDSETRLRFLGALDEALRAARDAPAAMLAAAELLALHLRASRTAYADVDADSDRFIIRDDYTASGIASSAGTYSLDLFGPRAGTDMRAGRTLVVRDVAVELAPDEGREMFMSIGIGAIVCCPLVRNGRLVAMMAVHQDAPRDWQNDEVGLVEVVVERCWAHVERVGAEARLRESEARARGVLEGMAEGFVLLDTDFRVVDINSEGLRLEERPREAIVGKTHWEAWPGTVESELGRLYMRAMAERVPVALEHRHVWEDGREAWIEMRGYPTPDGGLALFYRDVTQRRQLEVERERLVAVMEQSPDFIGIADAGGRGIYLNRGARTMCGLPENMHASDVEIIDFFASEDRDFVRDVVLPAQATDRGYQGELRFRRFDGSEAVPVSYDGFAIRDERGEITAFATVTRDITERVRAEAALRAAGEQAGREAAERSAILGQLGEGVIVADAEGRITFVNDAAERLHGVKLLGVAPDDYADTYDLLTEDGEPYPPRELPLARAVLDGETVEGARWRIRRPDGSEVLAIGNARPVLGADGERIGAVLTIRDDTERSRSEVELQETSRRLDAILSNTREAVFLMDHRQHCAYANAAAEALTGYAFAEMQGRPLHDVIHNRRPDGSHYPLEECPIDRAFPEHAQTSGEELFVHKDGSFYPVAFTASPVLDQEGRPIGTVIEARGISKEKAARERLTQLAAVAEQSRDFIGVADAAGFPVFVNEAGRAMMGLPSLEAACKVELIDYLAPADRDLIATEALPSADREGYWEGEVSFRRFDDGREFPVLYNLFPVRDEGGIVTHYATVTRDLSEKKNVESELRQLNATLEERVAEEVAERARAEEALRQSQKMEAVGQLTGGIAHDFNNLLTIVVGNTDMARRALAAGETVRAARAVDNAQKGAERAAALTQRLLAFSRRQPLAPKPTNVDKLVAGMSDLLHRALGETVELETVSNPGLWRVEVDPNQLESAVLNLAVNARDAMPSGGKLTIETANARLDEGYSASHAEVAPGSYVVIAVTDTGRGMPKETLARVFEPFFTTKEVGKGTGLGLSMVYGFTKQSGGHIKVYSEVDEGTTVKIYLPRLMSEADEPEEAPPVAEGTGDRETCVLVAEDDDDVRAYTVEILRELGYRVLEAHDGPAALRLIERQDARIDLLFTDVVMPGMSGRELVDAARELRPDLKVLYTSGYTRNAIVHGGRLDAGVEMIAKPFTYAALAEKIRDVLDAGRTGRLLVVEDEPNVRMFAVEALAGAGYAVEEAATGSEALNKVRAAQGRYDAVILDVRLPEKAGDALAVELRAMHADLPILLASGEHESELRAQFAGDRCIGVVGKPYNAAKLVAALDALGVSCAAERKD